MGFEGEAQSPLASPNVRTLGRLAHDVMVMSQPVSGPLFRVPIFRPDPSHPLTADRLHRLPDPARLGVFSFPLWHSIFIKHLQIPVFRCR